MVECAWKIASKIKIGDDIKFFDDIGRVVRAKKECPFLNKTFEHIKFTVRHSNDTFETFYYPSTAKLKIVKKET